MKLVVKEIGAMVESFESELFFILFGEMAPQELRDFSVIHEYTKADDGEYFEVGGKIIIDGTSYKIEEVGSHANKNFHELGHVSVYLKDDKILPGAIRISGGEFPKFKVGDEIRIEKIV